MEFTLEKEFSTSAEGLYRAWLSSEKHSEMTGGKAEVSSGEGGHFTAWDGYISGRNLQLEPHRLIKQSWRTSQFRDDQEDSVLEIRLKEESPGTTKVTLRHSNLTEEDHHYKQGWQDHYFEPMEKYFGTA